MSWLNGGDWRDLRIDDQVPAAAHELWHSLGERLAAIEDWSVTARWPAGIPSTFSGTTPEGIIHSLIDGTFGSLLGNLISGTDRYYETATGTKWANVNSIMIAAMLVGTPDTSDAGFHRWFAVLDGWRKMLDQLQHYTAGPYASLGNTNATRKKQSAAFYSSYGSWDQDDAWSDMARGDYEGPSGFPGGCGVVYDLALSSAYYLAADQAIWAPPPMSAAWVKGSVTSGTMAYYARASILDSSLNTYESLTGGTINLNCGTFGGTYGLAGEKLYEQTGTLVYSGSAIPYASFGGTLSYTIPDSCPFPSGVLGQAQSFVYPCRLHLNGSGAWTYG